MKISELIERLKADMLVCGDANVHSLNYRDKRIGINVSDVEIVFVDDNIGAVYTFIKEGSTTS